MDFRDSFRDFFGVCSEDDYIEDCRDAETRAVDMWLCGGSFENVLAPLEDVYTAGEMMQDHDSSAWWPDYESVPDDIGVVLGDEPAPCKCGCGETAVLGVARLPFNLYMRRN